MASAVLTVRELDKKDIELIVGYWFSATPEHLKSMGVDADRMPSCENFTAMLDAQTALPYPEKKAYALIWEVDGEPIGHCNLNPVTFADTAHMHLHIWDSGFRRKGMGAALVKMSLPQFFDNFRLNKLYCEPYSLNPAPNKVLAKAGFTFVKEYVTTPGAITFEQPVKLWEIRKEDLGNQI